MTKFNVVLQFDVFFHALEKILNIYFQKLIFKCDTILEANNVFLCVCVCVYALLGMQSGTWCMLGKHSTAELHFQPPKFLA